MRLSIALIAGPMYRAMDQAIEIFRSREGIAISVDFRGDHPSLNRHLAGPDANQHDLVSTHIKYAPAQRELLAPVDAVFNAGEFDDFMPIALEMTRMEGELWGIPRNLDLRLLHRRSDVVPRPLASWEELLIHARKANDPGVRAGFAFPGRESGLFGSFYELSAMAGARLFTSAGDPDLGPADSGGACWALELLRRFHAERLVPDGSIDWHYDDVTACFRRGGVAMASDWPGTYQAYADPSVAGSQVAGRFSLDRHPPGPLGRSLSYGGCHTFALTRRGARKSEARALLRHLTSPESQWLDARAGSLPVRRSLLRKALVGSRGPEAERWRMLELAMHDGMLVPPLSPGYPVLEQTAWRMLQHAIRGHITIAAALEELRRAIAAMGPCVPAASFPQAHAAQAPAASAGSILPNRSAV